MDKTSMVLGWLVGRQLAGQRGKKLEQPKEPIAYRYNGIWMPPLHSEYVDEYPYVILVPGDELVGSYYCFVFSKSPITTYQEGGSTIIKRLGDKPMAWVNREGDFDWTTANPTNSSYVFPADCVVWSNHDIYNEDGSVCLAASDPIPVYE